MDFQKSSIQIVAALSLLLITVLFQTVQSKDQDFGYQKGNENTILVNSHSQAQKKETSLTDKKTVPTPMYINSHMHTTHIGFDDTEYRSKVLQEMDKNHIAKTILHINEPNDIETWIKVAPKRFLAGPSFPCFKKNNDGQHSCAWDEGIWPSIEWLTENYENGNFIIMGEMFFVYAGISPSDSKMDKYWKLAAEMDIPVMIHINRGPPKDSPIRSNGCCPKFNSELGNPELLRPILEQYPSLRISLQHAGFPALPSLDNIDYLEETFSLMRDYPNIYVDMTALNVVPPSFVHEAAVKAFLKEGFIDKIMMGSDNWPIAPIIERYKGFKFLTEKQKSGIFYNNIVRFIGLKENHTSLLKTK